MSRLNIGIDRILRMTVHDRELRFYTEVKTNLTNVTLAQVVLHKINEAEVGKIMLVTRYVNPEMANQLKDKGIQFIDTAGNAYINQPPLYIFVKGNRLPEAFWPAPMKRAFKPTGLRIIFAFLCNSRFRKQTISGNCRNNKCGSWNSWLDNERFKGDGLFCWIWGKEGKN